MQCMLSIKSWYEIPQSENSKYLTVMDRKKYAIFSWKFRLAVWYYYDYYNVTIVLGSKSNFLGLSTNS